MLTITEAANEQIKEILLGEQSKFIRAFVQGGGCSGMSYGFTFDEEIPLETELDEPLNDIDISAIHKID